MFLYLKFINIKIRRHRLSVFASHSISLYKRKNYKEEKNIKRRVRMLNLLKNFRAKCSYRQITNDQKRKRRNSNIIIIVIQSNELVAAQKEI
jgi:hypothetical protein